MVMDADVPVVESGGKKDFFYSHTPGMLYPAAKVDRVLHDGDTVSLGDTVLMGNPVPASRIFRFDDYTLDARTGELVRNGTKLALREQPLQLLLALLEQPGELVSREHLIGRLWEQNTFVDFDRGLNKAVNHLRETLGDSAEHPRYVETLPRKGYRFVGQLKDDERPIPSPVLIPPQTRSRSRWWLAIPAAALVLSAAVAANFGSIRTRIVGRLHPGPPRISSIAVIPLESLSGDRDQEYFTDGLTDELITNLANIGSTRVVSRASILRYKGTKQSIAEIGRALDADAIIEGTVTRSGNRMSRMTCLIIFSGSSALSIRSFRLARTNVETRSSNAMGRPNSRNEPSTSRR